MKKGCIRAAVAAGAVLWMAFMPSLGAAQDIRLMSYNILHGKGADGQVDIPRIANVISREKPDFVGLQEVDRGVSRSHGIDEPAELGRLTGLHPTFASAFPYRGGEYGRAMLSREVPLTVDKIQLDGAHPGVLLLCEFTNFWFGTMHLDLAVTNRLRQVEIVRRAVLERSKTKPVFLTGDWNDSPRSIALAKMREFMTILSSENAKTFHGYKKGDPLGTYCIDYIAVDTAHAGEVNVKETHVTEERIASDHNPVVATIQFMENLPPRPPVVVIPDKATPVERFAARELAGELGKCLGTTPKILPESRFYTAPVLYVGATRASRALRGGRPWRTDEVRVESINGGVVMDGDPKRAPIYAVDLYLEKCCGVRWWTADAATHPKLEKAPMEGININYAPQFKYRESHWLGGFDPLFKVRSKGNFTSCTRATMCVMPDAVKSVPPQMGGDHSLLFFKERNSAFHSFFVILPPAVHFKDHPDWYSLIDGKRVPKQLCLSNAEMKAAYIQETLRRLRENPNVDFIQVSQNDGYGGWCECEGCKALMDEDGGVPSGPYIRFANDVAEAVEKEFPRVCVDTFAYTFTVKPPKKTRPRRNVIVRYCTYRADISRPLDDASSPTNTVLRAGLEAWAPIASGNLLVWNYVTDFHNYMLPHPSVTLLAPDIHLFAKNGAVGVFEQADALCPVGSFVGLRHYLASHLLWDPNENDARLMDEFLEGYYGKSAAPHLRRFVCFLDAASRKEGQFVNLKHDGMEFLTQVELLKLAAIMDEAVAAAEKDGAAFAERVRRERLSVDNGIFIEYDALRDLAAKSGIPWTRPATRAEAVEKWIAEVKALGVRAIRETLDPNDLDVYFQCLRKGGGKPVPYQVPRSVIP